MTCASLQNKITCSPRSHIRQVVCCLTVCRTNRRAAAHRIPPLEHSSIYRTNSEPKKNEELKLWFWMQITFLCRILEGWYFVVPVFVGRFTIPLFFAFLLTDKMNPKCLWELRVLFRLCKSWVTYSVTHSTTYGDILRCLPPERV